MFRLLINAMLDQSIVHPDNPYPCKTFHSASLKKRLGCLPHGTLPIVAGTVSVILPRYEVSQKEQTGGSIPGRFPNRLTLVL